MPFIQHFSNEGLGHASFLLGDVERGVAAVVDPARDVDQYLRAARDAGVRITLVLDTHAHSDYLSGVGALVEAGAEAVAPIGATVEYPAIPGRHGRRLEVGSLVLELLHTPGHTPEHTAVLVHGLGGAGPVLLSGGSLLVGDVGRPDLLGDDAERAAAAEAMVRTMLDTVLALPDTVEVLPTHVGGSLCAGSIGAERSTTVAEQRADNPTLVAMLEDPAAVDRWLRPELLPPVPPFWARARALNLRGVPRPQRDHDAAPDQLAARDVAAVRAGVTMLDVRDAEAWSRSHVAGSINIPLHGSFSVWAASTVPELGPVWVVADDAASALEAHRELLAVRVEGVGHWFPAGQLGELAPALLDAGGVVGPEELAELLAAGEVTLVDVRDPGEVLARPLVGAVAVPATVLLRDPLAAPDGRLAVACASGYRAGIAASVLRRAGRADVVAVDGSPFDVAAAAGAVGAGRASGLAVW
ncbi:MAG: glpE [Thermoleophilia bacterium]|nr:glpE [Thermoleophilia bacterium]